MYYQCFSIRKELNLLFMSSNAPFKWYNFIALMIHEVIIVERLWNDTDKAEPKDWEKLVAVLMFITNRACISLGLNQNLPGQRPASSLLNHGKAKFNFMAIKSKWLTPWSRVLLEKLTVCQPVKQSPAFYGTRRSITALTSARHLSLSWASSIQSIPLHSTSWRSVLILTSHLRLGLPSDFFPSSFPTKPQYVLPAPHISFFLIWSPE